MITPVNLNERTRKDLEQMAKRQGISGWRDMRKDQLVRALKRMAAKGRNRTRNRAVAANGSKPAGGEETKRSRASKTAASSKKNTPVKANGVGKPGNGSAGTKSPLIVRKIKLAHEERERLRDLTTEISPASTACDTNGAEATRRRPKRKLRRDRLVLMVRDSYWLHACWEVSRASVERIRAAMCEFWHTAKPVLRLVEVDLGSTTSTAERVVREIEVHGGVKNWYLDVNDPPKSYRVDLGYLAANGRFHSVIRSNAVTTPRPGANDALDQNWTDVAKE
ncbi:MAG: DUF4912 domain-containing protein, partial [Pirellulaceae bacterium]|nr:DUF4912 domain-containing protein [Pirellulaceae bacterium]